MPSKWTAEHDVALLMAIIEKSGAKVGSKGFWESIVERLGDKYTIRAVAQHYDILRKRLSENGVHGVASSGGPATPSSKSAATPGSRKRKAVDIGDSGVEDTPSKKGRVKGSSLKNMSSNNDDGGGEKAIKKLKVEENGEMGHQEQLVDANEVVDHEIKAEPSDDDGYDSVFGA